MKYIVEPQYQEKQDGGPPPHSITLCWLCKEDPRACGGDPI